MRQRKTNNRRRATTQAWLRRCVEMLCKEDFRRSGIGIEEILDALPKSRGSRDNWAGEIRRLLGRRPRAHMVDEILVVDLSLALDRVFGRPDGYFVHLWADMAVASRVRKVRRWLETAKSVHQETTHPKPAPAPEPWMVDAANDIDRTLGLPRFDSALADVANIIAFNYAEALQEPSKRMAAKAKPSGVGRADLAKIGVFRRHLRRPKGEDSKTLDPAAKKVRAQTVVGLAPPNGHVSWLAYAVATMDTRNLTLEHRCGHQSQWPAAVSSEDFREAARAALTRQRGTASEDGR